MQFYLQRQLSLFPLKGKFTHLIILYRHKKIPISSNCQCHRQWQVSIVSLPVFIPLDFQKYILLKSLFESSAKVQSWRQRRKASFSDIQSCSFNFSFSLLRPSLHIQFPSGFFTIFKPLKCIKFLFHFGDFSLVETVKTHLKIWRAK